MGDKEESMFYPGWEIRDEDRRQFLEVAATLAEIANPDYDSKEDKDCNDEN